MNGVMNVFNVTREDISEGLSFGLLPKDDARVEGTAAAIFMKDAQGVNVQFLDFREINQELGEAQQRLHQGIDIRWFVAARASQ